MSAINAIDAMLFCREERLSPRLLVTDLMFSIIGTRRLLMKEFSFPKNEIKILLLENIHPVATEMLRQEGFHVETAKTAYTETELLAKAKDVHILGIRSKTHLTQKYFNEAKR